MLHGNLIARADESPFSFEHSTASQQGDYVVVPAELLFHAEFKRVGSDLKLIGQDGKAFLVTDYFKDEHRPKLVAPNGAGLSDDVIEALAGPVAPGQYAQAGTAPQGPELVGKVVSVTGSAQIVRNGVAISIIFTDTTTFNLSANARMVINEFVYDPNGSANASLISLVQGTIGFV